MTQHDEVGPGAVNSAVPERAKPRSSRERILDAAVRVAFRDGALAMTLDGVAKEAGVSKGGLLHHFRTKDDLLIAMLQVYSGKVLHALEERIAADDNPRGRWFRSFVQTVFQPIPEGETVGPPPSEMMSRLFTAILVASANNPQLLEPMRQKLGQIRERVLAEEPNGLREVALWPAVYGLLLWQHLGFLTAADPLRQAVLDELLSLAEGPAPSKPGG